MNKFRALYRWLSEDEYGRAFLTGFLYGASCAAIGYLTGYIHGQDRCRD